LFEESVLLFPRQELEKLEERLQSVSGLPAIETRSARKSAQIISKQYPRDLSEPSIKAAVSIACSTTGIWLCRA
jgi:hypothetical protein